MIYKKTYKINAKEIEVRDKYNVFDSESLEDVLFELYKQNSMAFHYEIVANEKINNGQLFFEDSGLLSYRTDNRISVEFVSGYIRVNSNTGWTQNPSFVIRCPKKINHTIVKTNIYFAGEINNDNGDSVEIKIKKFGDTFYSLKLDSKSYPKIIESINGVRSTIWHNQSQIITRNIPYEIMFMKFKTKFMVKINDEIYQFNDENNRIQQEGSVEMETRFANQNSSVMISYLTIGQFLYESSGNLTE